MIMKTVWLMGQPYDELNDSDRGIAIVFNSEGIPILAREEFTVYILASWIGMIANEYATANGCRKIVKFCSKVCVNIDLSKKRVKRGGEDGAKTK